MKKKSDDFNIFIPGENGWDVWSCSSSKVRLISQTKEKKALDVDKIPSNAPLHMAFPVNELTCLELWSPTKDKESVKGLIDLQIENMGLTQTDENGILSQHTLIRTTKEHQSLYSIDVLKAPVEGSLPAVSPAKFNVSPRCFKVKPRTVTLWKEFGRWVLSVSNGKGKVLHHQGLTNTTLNTHSLDEIKFIIAQLRIQNIISSPPEHYVIWSQTPDIEPEGYNNLKTILKDQLSLEPKPLPSFPTEGSLLPADTRAERVHAKQKKRNTLIGSMLALLTLGGLGYAVYHLWSIEKQAKQATARAKTLTDENQSIIEHYSKWDELGPLVDSENSPLNLLLKCMRSIPGSKITLKRAEFTNQVSDQPESTQNNLSILLQGETDKFQNATTFDENLQKNKELSHLQWENQDPSQSKTGWQFIYRAIPK